MDGIEQTINVVGLAGVTCSVTCPVASGYLVRGPNARVVPFKLTTPLGIPSKPKSRRGTL